MVFSARSKRARQARRRSPAAKLHPGRVRGEPALTGCSRHRRWPSGDELLIATAQPCPTLPPSSLPSAAASNVSWCCFPQARRCPDGGKVDWRTPLVLPAVMKSTGTSLGSANSSFHAGPCTTLKWFSCH